MQFFSAVAIGMIDMHPRWYIFRKFNQVPLFYIDASILFNTIKMNVDRTERYQPQFLSQHKNLFRPEFYLKHTSHETTIKLIKPPPYRYYFNRLISSKLQDDKNFPISITTRGTSQIAGRFMADNIF